MHLIILRPRQFTNPHIPIMHRVAMVLERNRHLRLSHQARIGPHALVRRPLPPPRRPIKLPMILHHDPIEQQRQRRRPRHLPLLILNRRMENNIIRIEFTRRTARIHQRRILPIHSPRNPIRIIRILIPPNCIRIRLIRIQNLHLIIPHHKDARIAAPLTHPLHLRRRRPLHMQLKVRIFPLRKNVSSPRDRNQITLLIHRPLRRLTLRIAPILLNGLRRPIKQNLRIRRHLPRLRGNFLHARPIIIMHRPRMLRIWRRPKLIRTHSPSKNCRGHTQTSCYLHLFSSFFFI